MQQLMGQVEQLTFEVRRLQGQRKSGDAGEPVQRKKRQVVNTEDAVESQGIEQIEGDTQYTQAPLRTIGDDGLPEGAVQRRPARRSSARCPVLPMAARSNGSQQGNGGYDQSGEFQGQVLVPPAGQGGDGQVEGRALIPPSNDGGGQVLVPSENGGDGGNDSYPKRSRRWRSAVPPRVIRKPSMSAPMRACSAASSPMPKRFPRLPRPAPRSQPRRQCAILAGRDLLCAR